jgi:mannose-6-phosphate isomerase
VLERIDLPENSKWQLNADQETWLLVIEGHARIGSTNTVVGDAIFVEADRTGIEVGSEGLIGLIAYPGPDPAISLLQSSADRMTEPAGTTFILGPKLNEIVEAQT